MDNWNSVLEESKKQFPNPMDDPRRTQKGRGWFGKKSSGMIEPSTPESFAACQKVLDDIKKESARNAIISANISRHRNEKNYRHNKVFGDAIANHAVETGMRYAKHASRRKDPNRFDLVFAAIAIVLCGLAVWVVPQLAMGLK